jgi:hypothetical protein
MSPVATPRCLGSIVSFSPYGRAANISWSGKRANFASWPACKFVTYSSSCLLRSVGWRLQTYNIQPSRSMPHSSHSRGRCACRVTGPNIREQTSWCSSCRHQTSALPISGDARYRELRRLTSSSYRTGAVDRSAALTPRFRATTND